MNRTTIGQAIGADVLEERRVVTQRFWDEWGAKFPRLPVGRQQELMAQLHLLESQAMGNGIITHVPGWREVDFDPSAVGLDLPEPSIVTQKDLGGVYVTTWWKDGPTAYDWTNFAGGGGGGGGTTTLGFKTAAAVNFRTEEFRALYSTAAPPHYYTIGGKVFQVQNQVAYGPTGGQPWLTGPGSPGGRNGALRWNDNTWSVFPIVQAPLLGLGVPALSKVAEVWIFVEFVPPAGDTGAFQKLIFGLSDAPTIYGKSDLVFKMVKIGYNGGRVYSTTQGILEVGATTTPITSRLDTDTVMAMRLLPNCVELYSGVPQSAGDAYLCEISFASLRTQMKRLGVLAPSNADRAMSLSAAWADGAQPTIFLTSDANRVGDDGPAWRAVRVDYCEAGLVGAGSVDSQSVAFETVNTSSGLALLSGTKRSVKLGGSEDLLGMSTEGLSEGAEETVYFLTARTIKHAATVGAGYAPLALQGSVDFEVPAKTMLKFKLVDDGGLVWRNTGGAYA